MRTADAFERLGEILELRQADGLISAEEVSPLLLVRAQPRYTDSVEGFAVQAIDVLKRAFGEDLRLCEACMAPRAWFDGGQMVYQTGPVSLQEVIRLDEQTRGTSPPARAAAWIEEQRHGLSVRIVDLGTGRVIFAQNVDPDLVHHANTQRVYTLTEELERRARRDSLTQAFVDMSLLPGQHISIDWTDQWGRTNDNLTGLTLSVLDPVLGIGVSHYRRVPVLNALVGGKAVVSLPTAVLRSFDAQGGEVLDPLLTAVGVVRVPFGRSNYGAIATVSTNGTVGVGLSLMNISLLPVIP